MKSVILLAITYLVIGMEVMACATTPSPEPPKPLVLSVRAIVPPCSDKVLLLDEEALKQGAACPENTRLVFPSYYQQGKVLVLCQCK